MTDGPNAPQPRQRLRVTTGGLMAWIFAVAVGLGFLQGDVTDWVPRDAYEWSGAAVMLATVLGIPWLSYQLARSRSPEARKPSSARSRRVENLLVVGCLGWITAAVLMFVLLCSMIFWT